MFARDPSDARELRRRQNWPSAAGCTPAGPKPEQTADAIYTGGDIVTVNDAQPAVEALAVKDGKILGVGTRAEVEKAHKGATTRVVDLGGKTLLPSFIDSHSHYINTLSVASQVKLYAPPAGPGKDVDSIVAEIKRFAEERQIPKGEMIMAYGYDDTVMPGGRLLNRDDLDAAFPDNPVRVDHVSMHGAVMNSVALKQFGFDSKTKTPGGGVIVRKPGTSEPWGLIMETAFLPVFEKTPPMTPAQEVEGTKAAQRMYAEAGITTARGRDPPSQLKTIKRATDAAPTSSTGGVPLPRTRRDARGVLVHRGAGTTGSSIGGVQILDERLARGGPPDSRRRS